MQSSLSSLGLSAGELRILETALSLDFPDKKTIFKQLSNCLLSKKRDSESIEILFDKVDTSELLLSPYRNIASFRAFREKGAYLDVVFLSWKRKIDSLYIYMPDGSKLDLESFPLENIEYDIGDYCMEADEWIRFLYDASLSNAWDKETSLDYLSCKIERLINDVKHNSDLFFMTEDKVRVELHDEKSIRLVIDLGYINDNHYEGVACVSAVSDFFFTYVRVNNIDIMQPLDEDDRNFIGQFPNGIINYPDGYLLERIRKCLYAIGYKPLTGSFIKSAVDMQYEGFDAAREKLTYYDWLFLGKGVT